MTALENVKDFIDYDEDADVLYVSIGKPRKAVSREIEDGILVRCDINTDEVVGVTILHYLRRANDTS